MTVLFNSRDLLPDEWREPGIGAVRTFNPGLIATGNGWLMAYRVVIEPKLERRIAMCRLDASFRVLPGSATPFSDYVHFPPENPLPAQAYHWFADPRLYRLQGRLFMYWNSGWHEPQNCQFLQELDAETLLPIGRPRELRLRQRRQKLEKNWGLFEADGLYGIYSVTPHRLLEFSLAGDGPIEFTEARPAFPNEAGYARIHGGLRGGAPPVLHERQFYSFCHSIEHGPQGYQYVAGVYTFRATFPFEPTGMPVRPIDLAVPESARRAFPKLNTAIADVVYPTGAVRINGGWAVSTGVDDERCAIAFADDAEVRACLATP